MANADGVTPVVPGNLTSIWMSLLDDDGDLAADDLGKVDLVSSVDDRSTADDERTIELEACGTATPTTANSNVYRPRDGTVDDNNTPEDTTDDWTWVVDSAPCVEIVKATGGGGRCEPEPARCGAGARLQVIRTAAPTTTSASDTVRRK